MTNPSCSRVVSKRCTVLLWRASRRASSETPSEGVDGENALRMAAARSTARIPMPADRRRVAVPYNGTPFRDALFGRFRRRGRYGPATRVPYRETCARERGRTGGEGPVSGSWTVLDTSDAHRDALHPCVELQPFDPVLFVR